MGAFLPKPITTTKKEEGAGNELTWNVCSMQGWRVDMEDAHIAKVSLIVVLARPRTSGLNRELLAVFI